MKRKHRDLAFIIAAVIVIVFMTVAAAYVVAGCDTRKGGCKHAIITLK